MIGNPLYRSPIYNTDNSIDVRNNRFYALHLGVEGSPTERLDYRVLTTYQKGWGTYNNPFTKAYKNLSFLVEAKYKFNHDWTVRGGYAMDFGSEKMYGHNAGFQLTVTKSGLLTKKK